jgi:hypothetical protein
VDIYIRGPQWVLTNPQTFLTVGLAWKLFICLATVDNKGCRFKYKIGEENAKVTSVQSEVFLFFIFILY